MKGNKNSVLQQSILQGNFECNRHLNGAKSWSLGWRYFWMLHARVHLRLVTNADPSEDNAWWLAVNNVSSFIKQATDSGKRISWSLLRNTRANECNYNIVPGMQDLKRMAYLHSCLLEIRHNIYFSFSSIHLNLQRLSWETCKVLRFCFHPSLNPIIFEIAVLFYNHIIPPKLGYFVFSKLVLGVIYSSKLVVRLEPHMSRQEVIILKILCPSFARLLTRILFHFHFFLSYIPWYTKSWIWFDIHFLLS